MLRRIATQGDQISALGRNVTPRTILWCCFFIGALLVQQPVRAATITGTVFEDVNYGGGDGRPIGASGTLAVANVRVELYRVSSGTLIASTTTNGVGFYTIDTTGSAANQAAAHYLRVVSGTVRSTRGAACTTCVAVQTYRTDATSGAALAVLNNVGGQNPALPDAASNTSSANYSTLNVAGTQAAHSITVVDPAQSTSVIANVDFGFNFDTVVNTRDLSSCAPSGTNNTFFPCQGALRQFIINANALGGEGALSQAGDGYAYGADIPLPSGYESSIFMIPSGALTGGVAVIALAATLTTVSGANTRLDATTQTANVGDTNGNLLGSGANPFTVGVDAITLPGIPRSEVQINGTNSAITLSAANQHILGFALRQAFIVLSGTSAVAQYNLVGMTAGGDSSLATTGIGIVFQGTNALVRNNFVTVNNSGIRTDGGGSGSIIEYNEVARPTSGHSNTFDGILLVGTVSNTQVRYNLARDQAGGGIEIGFGGGATASSITITNNTVQGNGFTTGTTASTEPVGFVAYAFTGNNIVVSRNRIQNNAGAGALIMTGTNVAISQNAFSNNGGLSIDLDARNLDPNTMTTVEGVTLNDLNDSDGGSNNSLNYPVITSAYIIGSDLTINGFARPGSSIELYLAQADPTGFGEGLTFLGTLLEGSGSDLNSGTGAYGPAAINGVAQGQDNTNRFTFRFAVPGGVSIGSRLTSTATLAGNTSEFGGNVVVTGGPSLLHLKSVQVISDPFNNTTNPKSVPGSTQLYTIRITNQGAGALDANSVSVSDAVAANTKLFVGNIGGAGSGPVAFTNGAPSSGLTYTFAALNNTTDDLEFSNDGGTSWTYVPTPDADNCDVSVTNIRVRPKGTMPGNGGGDPYFELRFRVLIR